MPVEGPGEVSGFIELVGVSLVSVWINGSLLDEVVGSRFFNWDSSPEITELSSGSSSAVLIANNIVQ